MELHSLDEAEASSFLLHTDAQEGVPDHPGEGQCKYKCPMVGARYVGKQVTVFHSGKREAEKRHGFFKFACIKDYSKWNVYASAPWHRINEGVQRLRALQWFWYPRTENPPAACVSQEDPT